MKILYIFAMSLMRHTYLEAFSLSALMNLDSSANVERIRKRSPLVSYISLDSYTTKGVSCFLIFDKGLSRAYQWCKLSVLRLLILIGSSLRLGRKQKIKFL